MSALLGGAVSWLSAEKVKTAMEVRDPWVVFGFCYLFSPYFWARILIMSMSRILKTEPEAGAGFMICPSSLPEGMLISRQAQ